jgi:NitT/TauT family transport system substrate-binding protein
MGRTLLFGMAASLALAACGSNSDTSSTQSSSGVEKPNITVGALVVPDAAPLHIAIKQGFFKAEGLTVKYNPIKSAIDVIPGLLGGTTDFSLFNYMTAFSYESKNPGTFKFVADSYQSAPNTFVVMVPGDSKIKTPQDLKGKTIAIPGLNTIGQLAVTANLKTAGVDAKADGVKFVEIAFPLMPQALKTKQVDAAWMVEPFISAVQKDQGARKLADTMTGPMADFAIAGWASSAKFVKDNPKTVAAFQRAMAKAQQIAASDRKAVEQILPTYSLIKPEVASIIALGTYPTTLNETRLQRVSDVMQEFGFLTQKGDAKSLIAGQTGT